MAAMTSISPAFTGTGLRKRSIASQSSIALMTKSEPPLKAAAKIFQAVQPESVAVGRWAVR
jgi:hypothetical protein